MITPAQSRLIEAELAPAALQSKITSSLAAKALDAQRQQGANILKLLSNASTPPAGDPLTAKATGLGSRLDITV